MQSERLDLSSEPPQRAAEEASPDRPYLGIHFACCSVYSRIYRNAEQTAYVGHCPRCTCRVQVNIVQSGTYQRFFTVY